MFPTFRFFRNNNGKFLAKTEPKRK